ncbi:substrate-binding domain-containing protein [Dactylosporangium vinaceum]|uniref:Substrate-binding domain-containing protein n=1 Tax=Dactylosporangium vinaceum TaxID=53362 RepID=A0ABV5MSS3_9ACTN|nr:substrate-binding domain-containing protein [Dactylosporangium vinaceum]UAB97696.1 substrate-binding domain-containing protein [Dactylosporangium vinaceum]
MINTKRLVRRLLVGGIATATVATGLVAGVAGPASADPVGALAGVGSDTTQDVLNGAADSIGNGIVGSWDAVDPITKTQHLVFSPKRSCTLNRPNGSGQGVTALRQSGGVAAAIAAPFADEVDQPEAGCIDFARSSGDPGTSQANGGRWVYVPFALDAVTVASKHSGDATATNYNALSYDPANATTGAGTLQKLYRDGAQVTINGVTYDPQCAATCSGGATPIHLYIPQSGSGTRSFWLTKMGITTVPTWVHDRAFNGTDFSGALVEEHDGTVLQNDALGLAPFSISQWVGQRNNHGDRRNGAHLHSLVNTATGTVINPLTGAFPTAETGNLNTSFIIRREVYNVVEWKKVNVGNADFDAQLYSVFGPGQGLCSKSTVILNYGFGLLNSSPLGHTCGQIVDGLRAFATD